METTFYFPLTPFNVDLSCLPINFTPELTLRQSTVSEVELIGKKFDVSAWRRPRQDGRSDLGYGLTDLIHTTIERRASHDNDAWKLINCLNLLYDEIVVSGKFVLRDGKLRRRTDDPTEDVYLSSVRAIEAARSRQNLDCIELGQVQIKFLKLMFEKYGSKVAFRSNAHLNMLVDLNLVSRQSPMYFLGAMAIIDGMLIPSNERNKRALLSKRMKIFYDQVFPVLDLTAGEPDPRSLVKLENTDWNEIWEMLYVLRNHYAHGDTPTFGAGKLALFESQWQAQILLTHGVKSLIRWGIERENELFLFSQ